MVNVKLMCENTHFNEYSTNDKLQPIFSTPRKLDNTYGYLGSNIYYDYEYKALVPSLTGHDEFDHAISVVHKYLSENLVEKYDIQKYIDICQTHFKDRLSRIEVVATSLTKRRKYFQTRISALEKLVDEKMRFK